MGGKKGSIQKVIYMCKGSLFNWKATKTNSGYPVQRDLSRRHWVVHKPIKRLKKMAKSSGQLSIHQTIALDRCSYKATTTGNFTIKHRLLGCWTLIFIATVTATTFCHLFSLYPSKQEIQLTEHLNTPSI